MPKGNKSFKSKISILIISSSTFLAGSLPLPPLPKPLKTFCPKFSQATWPSKASLGASHLPLPLLGGRPKPLDILIQKHHHGSTLRAKMGLRRVVSMDGCPTTRSKQLRTFGQHRSKKFSDWQISNLQRWSKIFSKQLRACHFDESSRISVKSYLRATYSIQLQLFHDVCTEIVSFSDIFCKCLKKPKHWHEASPQWLWKIGWMRHPIKCPKGNHLKTLISYGGI